MKNIPFSVRYGYKQESVVLQLENVNLDLRNAVYSLVFEISEKFLIRKSSYISNYDSEYKDFESFIKNFFVRILRTPIDEIPDEFHVRMSIIKNYLRNSEWFKVYDFIEFVFDFLVSCNFYIEDLREIEGLFNAILEEFSSGYRIIHGKVSPITSQVEIDEINQAADDASKEVAHHINKAIAQFSKKPNPDFPNTIKESISALEGQMRLMTGESTYGRALKELQSKGKIPNNELVKMLENFYAYTNNKKDGIRHAKVEGGEIDVGFDEAKLSLVVSSAIINYLKTLE